MAEGKEDHERVAVALAIGPGGRDQFGIGDRCRILFSNRQNRFAFGIDLLLKINDRFNMMRGSRQKASTYLKEKQGIRTCHRGPSSGISRACVIKPKGSSSCTR
jgi:hypothetical protein